jgi:hypothetical protein
LVEKERGYHGWIVALLDNSTIVEGHGPTYSRIQDTTSYRMEVSCTIAILAIYVCDSESGLDRIWSSEPGGVFDQSRPDADVILVAKEQLQKEIHIKIVPTWVREQTDNRGPPYTDQEHINIRADKLA